MLCMGYLLVWPTRKRIKSMDTQLLLIDESIKLEVAFGNTLAILSKKKNYLHLGKIYLDKWV